jgi:hypothetical protein
MRHVQFHIPREELGTAPDSELATKYGCTPTLVRLRRNQAGIPVFRAQSGEPADRAYNRWRDQHLLSLAYREGMDRRGLLRALEELATGARHPLEQKDWAPIPSDWKGPDGKISLPGRAHSALAKKIRAQLGLHVASGAKV